MKGNGEGEEKGEGKGVGEGGRIGEGRKLNSHMHYIIIDSSTMIGSIDNNVTM